MEALRVATSHFCKARGIFRDSCFERKRIGEDGETVSVLRKPPSGDYGAEQLYNLLEFGVAECLDCECLRSVSLCIVRIHDNALLEELTLSCEAIAGSEYSQTSLSDAIRELTRKHRLLVQTLSPLPEETAFKVRLSLIGGSKMPYRAWTPPFFLSHCETHIPQPQKFDGKPVKLRIGNFSSDTENCVVSIQSLYDSLENLSSQDESQSASPQIAFDPVFTQVPSSDAPTAVEEADVDLYQTIKTFVVAGRIPSMKRAHEAHRHVTMPVIRTYFHQLVDEGVLVRRGHRFYPVKPTAAPVTEATTFFRQRQSPTLVATAESTSGKRMNRVSQKAAPAIAQLVQTYEVTHSINSNKCIPTASVPSMPQSRRTRAVLAASSLRNQVGEVSTQRFGRIVTAPIIQRIHQPHRVHDACPSKFGRPVFVASSSIVQVAQKPVCRRQKIAKVL